MAEVVAPICRSGEDTDLLCVEVSALGATAAAPPSLAPVRPKPVTPSLFDVTGGWQTPPPHGTDTTQEEFLRSLLVKTDAYRPRQESLRYMENKDFLAMRKAVVNWFANVSVSYDFANETVVAALSNFDRYVAVKLEPVTNHLLLQLAAYVSLLVASKMSEVSPLRMKSLANLTGRMFTPLEVQKCELDMISKLHFRLAPPSADEMLHCLSTLVHNTWPTGVPLADVLSTSACYLKKARARTCWFRHSPYTLAVAAIATAYNSLGLGHLKRSLLRECDSRARKVTGRGVDFHGVAACAAAMSGDERAAAAAAAAARAVRGGTESPICSKLGKDGWGSPTGVAQGAELLQAAALHTVGGLPLAEDLSPAASVPSPKAFGPCSVAGPKLTTTSNAAAAPIAARVAGNTRCGTLPSAACGSRRLSQPDAPGAGLRRSGQKRALHQSYGSCFVPCARRACLDGPGGRAVGAPSARMSVDRGHVTNEEEARSSCSGDEEDGNDGATSEDGSSSCTSGEDS